MPTTRSQIVRWSWESTGWWPRPTPLATLAGLGVLHEGGNAFDAAVAVGSTLGVVEPYMSGPGGIGVALMYVAREDRIRVLNFSGRAPAAAEPDRFADESKGVGILSSLVPGNVAGWLTMHEAYGSLERERLFRPAIGYAQEGFPVTYGNSHFMNLYSERLMLHPSAADIVLGPDGRAPSPGQRLRFPDLAGTLRTVARQGRETFYRGEIAERMVNANRQAGGLLGDDDLATYEAEWQEPVSITYRGYDVYTTPPNSSGFQILQTLKLMDGYPTGDIPYQAADTLHLFAEAVKLAVTDRIKYGGDPDHITAPIRGLLSDEYVSERRRLIDRERASVVSGEHYARIVPEGALMAGRPEEFDGGMTTHFAIADRDGNVVSITQTLGGFFGSAVPLGDTGVFLNNMCYWFDLDEGSPNRIGPGRRVDFVVAPTQSFLDGKFVLSMGTPGSWGHPPDHSADDYERAGLRDERAAGYRGAPAPLLRGAPCRDGGAFPPEREARPGAEGARCGCDRGLVHECRRSPGNRVRLGAGRVPGRRRPPPRRLRRRTLTPAPPPRYRIGKLPTYMCVARAAPSAIR